MMTPSDPKHHLFVNLEGVLFFFGMGEVSAHRPRVFKCSVCTQVADSQQKRMNDNDQSPQTGSEMSGVVYV